MGWVTLALRKASLKQEHAAYQLRLLQVSREKRQMARKKTYETNSIMNQQKQALRGLKESVYEVAKNEKNAALKEIDAAWKQYQNSNTLTSSEEDKKEVNLPLIKKGNNEKFHAIAFQEETDDKSMTLISGTPIVPQLTEDDQNSSSAATANNTMKSRSEWERDVWDGKSKNKILSDFEDASLQYQDQVNDTKSEYEFELQVVEEEAADEEVILDQEQTEIEAQMEAISQEMNAVGEAVSSQIQASTIKLA